MDEMKEKINEEAKIEDISPITLPEALQLATSATEPFKIANFINGQLCKTNDYLESIDPSTGKVWALIPDSDSSHVDTAVFAANQAFSSWSQTSAQYRSKLLLKIAEIIEQNLDVLAELESRDQGKPVRLAKTVDIPRCVHNFRFFATAILHDLNDSLVQHEPIKALNYVLRQPMGVAGLICPWNLPLYLLSFKIAPALAAGNTVVAKPSEMTSVTAWILAIIFKEAGLPAGVCNLVFGTGQKTGEPLVKHPLVSLISFTGSTLIGRRIAEMAAVANKKLSLEMGGKNPCLVFDSTDMDKHMATIVRSCFINQGQVCLCTSRLFVQQTIFEKFCEKFVKSTNMLTVGPPTEQVDLGAVVSREHYDKINRYIDSANKIGAKFLCGGAATNEQLKLSEKYSNGFYIRPTAITNVSDDSSLMQEEVFGPLVCILPFHSEIEAIQRANNVIYGLSACVYSQDVNQIHRVAEKLNAGTVWCNCWLVRELNMPFGGTKASGMGRESGKDSLDFYTEKKTVCLKLE